MNLFFNIHIQGVFILKSLSLKFSLSPGKSVSQKPLSTFLARGLALSMAHVARVRVTRCSELIPGTWWGGPGCGEPYQVPSALFGEGGEHAALRLGLAGSCGC